MKKLLSIVLAISTLVYTANIANVHDQKSSNGLIELDKRSISKNIVKSEEISSPLITTNKVTIIKKKTNNAADEKHEQTQEMLKQARQDALKKEKLASLEQSSPRIDIPSISVSNTSRHTADDLFFSEYAEGGSNRKYLEIYNGTGADVDMSGYAIGICNNGHGQVDGVDFDPAIHPYYEVLTPMVGTALAGDVFVVSRTNAGDDIIPEMDFDGGTGAGAPCSFNGNDWVGLYKISSDGTETLIDVIGPDPTIASPGYDDFNVAGESAACQNNTIVRKSSVWGGNTDWASSSGTDADNSEWVVYPQDYFDDLGAHTIVDPDAPLLSEGFEGTWPPEGWTSTGWDQSVYGGPNSGSNWAYSNLAGSELVSPTLSLPAGNDMLLKFFHRVESPFYPQDLTVLVNGVSVLDAVSLTNSSYEEASISLASYAGTDVTITFVAQTGTGGWDYGVCLDDVSVEAAPTNPVAELSTDALDFGIVQVGQSASLDLTVSNTGAGTLTGSLTSDVTVFAASPADISVASGESAVVTVTYTPSRDADDVGVLTLTHNGDAGSATVALSGTGTNDLLTESFEGTWPPEGWTSTGWDQSVYGGPYTGSNWAYSNLAGSELVAPTLSIPADSDMLLKFWYRVESPSYPQDLDVKIGDAVVWQGVQLTNGFNNYMQASVSLAEYAGTDVTITFVGQTGTGGWDYGVCLDDVTVEAAPVVPILSLGAESLLFSATALGETKTASVAVSNVGSGDLSGDITYSDGFTGPSSFGPEDTELQVSYAPTTSGLHSGTMTLVTNGGDATVALSGNAGVSAETFEGDVLVGWEILNNDGGFKQWELTEGDGHTGTGLMEVGYEVPNDDWLMTPKLDVQAGDKLSFFAGSGSSFYLEDMDVHLSTTGGLTPEDFDVVLGQYTSLPTGWTGYEFDLSAYAGTQVRIAVVCVSNDQLRMQLDDVAMPAVYVASDPVIYDYPMSLDFGMVQIGTSLALPFDFLNTGGSDLEVTSVTFGENSPFTLSDQTPLPVTTTPTSVGEFHVVFSPTEAMGYSDNMLVVHNGEGDDLTIPLQGAGTTNLITESFEGSWPPVGWTDETIESYGWDQNVYGGPYSGDNWAYNNLAGSELSTPTISVPSEGSYNLKFWYRAESSSYPQDLDVKVGDAVVWQGVGLDNAFGNYLEAVVSLADYAGTDISVTFIGQTGTGGFDYGLCLDHVTIELAPVVPVIAVSKLVFPATALGSSSTATLAYSNVGEGVLSATITYPASMTGPTTITGLEPLGEGSLEVTYTPTVAGMESEMLVIDGSESGAEAVSFIPEANAGELAFDLDSGWMRWRQYSLAGQPYVQNNQDGTQSVFHDRWARTGGPTSESGHGGSSYWAGVYSYQPYWGGVDDYLVSPRLDVEEGEVFSFWAQGGDPAGLYDNMVVYVASEEPLMGYDENGEMTGFTNMDTWTELYNGQPSIDSWDPHEYTLSADDDAYLIIHAAPNDPSGFSLKIDDVAHPDVYRNPNAVLNTYKTYSLGETGPMGATAEVFVQNSGEADLIIESMEFVHGHDFHVVATGLTFPLTLAAYETADFSVVLDPSDLGELEDHLMFTSNYDPADLDAFGGGTDHTVYKALVINGEPGPFTLLAPSDGTSIVLEADADLTGQYMNIAWNPSMDPDGEEIHYSFESTLSVEDDQGYITWEMDLDAPLNALMNGGFEDGMEGWLVFQTGQANVNIVTTDETFEALEGMHALAIEANHADGATYPNYTTVYRGHDLSAMGLLAGQELMVHGVAHPHGFEGSENSAYMFVRFYDANSALVTPPGYTLVSDLIDTEMEMSGGADDGWYPLHMHVVVPEGAMYMDVGVEYVTASAGHGGTVVLDEMGVFAPLTANTLTLSYDQALNHAIDDRVHHLSMGWTVYAMDPWSETQATNGPFTLTVDLSAYVDALSVDGGSTLPGKFALHNNYPNPFNPVTNITYDIPEVANVTLEIYNITGQKVRTLAQGSHEPGRYRVLWNATNDHGEGLSSGMYVYRIQAGDFVSTKKLVLMK